MGSICMTSDIKTLLSGRGFDTLPPPPEIKGLYCELAFRLENSIDPLQSLKNATNIATFMSDAHLHNKKIWDIQLIQKGKDMQIHVISYFIEHPIHNKNM